MAIPAGNRYVATRPVVLGIARLFILALCHLPLLSASPIFASPSRPFVALSEEPAKSPHDAGLWLYLGIAAALVLSGGAFAGLTIALMGQVCLFLSPQLSVLTQCALCIGRGLSASYTNLWRRSGTQKCRQRTQSPEERKALGAGHPAA